MPFYQYYLQRQATIMTSPPVLQKAVQSSEWKATGLAQRLRQHRNDQAESRTLTYPKNSQHILVDYTDDRADVAQAAVHR